MQVKQEGQNQNPAEFGGRWEGNSAPLVGWGWSGKVWRGLAIRNSCKSAEMLEEAAQESLCLEVCLGAWFSDHGGAGLVVGLDDLWGLFQP